jgi:hypothetical protein
MTYNLRLVSVRGYLEKKGWTIIQYNSLADKIMLNSEGEDFEIIIPNKEDMPDYNFRIEQLVNSLGSIEKRSANQISEEIENMGFDIMQFRFISDKYEAGTMPLTNFAKAIESIDDMIRFEACSELNPASQYTNPYEEAKVLMTNCEVAQTQKGSYIVNVRVPLGETYLKDIQKEQEYLRFLGRKTIKRLLTGISEAKKINLSNEKSFRETYDKKLNKQSCKAINELIENLKNAEVEINTKWDFSKPVDIELPEKTKLSQEDKEIFKTMENYLVKIPEDEEKTIKGIITDMRRSKDNDKEQTVSIYDSNLNRNIYVELSVESYERACNLYAKISNVSVRGILKKKNSKWILEDYKDFGIQPTLA